MEETVFENNNEISINLKAKAKELLSKQLLSMMNLHGDSLHLACVDEIVDSIVAAAVMEVAHLMEKTITKEDLPTEG